MQGPRILEAQDILMTSGPFAQETALRVSATVIALGALYSELLESMIFPHPLASCDRKELIRHRKCLIDDEAQFVLLIFWKESHFVTDEVLKRVGLKREFPNGSLNSWSLATNIVASPTDLAKTNTRIRGIAMAAEAYGLVEREKSRATRKPIQGTQRLHSFMNTLSENQSRLLAELVPFLSLANSGSFDKQ
jgi:hypothetical protein